MTSELTTLISAISTYGTAGGVVILLLLWIRRRVLDGTIRFTLEAATMPELKREIAQLRLDLAAAHGALGKAEAMSDAYLRHLEAEHDSRRRTDET